MKVVGNGVFGNAVLYDWGGGPLADFRSGRGELLLGYGGTSVSNNGAWGWDSDKAMSIWPKSNLITIAPNRSGKGTSVIIPNLLTCTMGMVVTDPKGENAWITARRRLQLGQKLAIIDPFNWVNEKFGKDPRSAAAGLTPLPITKFNPLAHLKPDGARFADDVDQLADAIIHFTGTSDSHWSDSAKQLVSGLIAYYARRLGPNATLSLVRDSLTLNLDDLGDTLGGMVVEFPDSFVSRRLQRFTGMEDSRELASIVSTAVTQTAFLDNDSIRNSTGAHDFDEAAFINGKATVYLVLPADMLKTHNRWLRLILSSLIARLVQRQDISGKVVFMLDEFGTIGHLQAIEDSFGLFPGYGMHSWIFPQDLSQLQRDYPNGWQNFIANAEVLQAFNIKSAETAEYLSNIVGRETVVTPVETQKPDHPTTYTGKPVFYPQELMNMAAPYQLVFHRGYPVRGARLDYFSDPYLKDLATPLPEFINKPAPPQPTPPDGNSKLKRLLVIIGAVVILAMLAYRCGFQSGNRDAEAENAATLDVPVFDGTLADNRRVNLKGYLWYVPEDGLPNISNQAMAYAINAAQACARSELTALDSLRDVGGKRFNEAVSECTNRRANARYKMVVTNVRLSLDR